MNYLLSKVAQRYESFKTKWHFLVESQDVKM